MSHEKNHLQLNQFFFSHCAIVTTEKPESNKKHFAVFQ